MKITIQIQKHLDYYKTGVNYITTVESEDPSFKKEAAFYFPVDSEQTEAQKLTHILTSMVSQLYT